MTFDISRTEQTSVSTYAKYGGYVGFALIGLLQAVYGPILIRLQDRFQISTGESGLTLTAHFTGALVGVLCFYGLQARCADRLLIAMSYILLAAGTVGAALSPTWPLLLGSIVLLGLGFGGIDFGLNQAFSQRFGDRAPATLNILNGMFALGAVVAPGAVAIVGPDNYSWLLLGCGFVAAALVLTALDILPLRPNSHPLPVGSTGAAGVSAIFLSFVVLYIFHVAVETGIGSWEPTHLVKEGFSVNSASVYTALFWAALMLGRFAAAPISVRFSASTITATCCVALVGCIALAAVPALAPFAYLGAGLAIAPIFPTCLPWLYRVVPHARGAGAFVVAASMIGGVVFPPMYGLGIDMWGVSWLPLMLGLSAAGCLVASIWLSRNAKNPTETVKST